MHWLSIKLINLHLFILFFTVHKRVGGGGGGSEWERSPAQKAVCRLQSLRPFWSVPSNMTINWRRRSHLLKVQVHSRNPFSGISKSSVTVTRFY